MGEPRGCKHGVHKRRAKDKVVHMGGCRVVCMINSNAAGYCVSSGCDCLNTCVCCNRNRAWWSQQCVWQGCKHSPLNSARPSGP